MTHTNVTHDFDCRMSRRYGCWISADVSAHCKPVSTHTAGGYYVILAVIVGAISTIIGLVYVIGG